MQWPADTHAFCSAYPADGFGTVDDRISTGCGTYRVFESDGVDTRTSYYYGEYTGKLVAIVAYYIDGSRRCIAGPADFTALQCDPWELGCTDGGHGGAPGVDGGSSGGDAGGMSSAGGGAGGMSGAGGSGGADAAP